MSRIAHHPGAGAPNSLLHRHTQPRGGEQIAPGVHNERGCADLSQAVDSIVIQSRIGETTVGFEFIP